MTLSYSVYNNLNSEFFLLTLTHEGTRFGGSVISTLTPCGKLNVFAYFGHKISLMIIDLMIMIKMKWVNTH